MAAQYTPARPSLNILKVISSKRRTKAKAKALSPKIQRLIAQMPPPIGKAFQQSLRKKWRGKGFADPKEARDATIEMRAKAVRDACVACAEYGVMPTSFKSLGEAPALDALRRRVEAGKWAGQSLGSVLGKIHTVYRILYGHAPPLLRVRMTHWAQSPRTSSRPRRQVEQYIDGSMAIAAVADIALSAGEDSWARALLTDAALLAGAATLNGRRGEYAVSDLKMAAFRSVDAQQTFTVYWDSSIRKNKKTRSVDVFDPRAVNLIRRVTEGRQDGPVFPHVDGSANRGDSIYTSLRRSTFLALGVRVGPNGLRDAGTSSTTDPIEMGRRIGSSSKIALSTYRGSIASEGEQLIKNALDAWSSPIESDILPDE